MKYFSEALSNVWDDVKSLFNPSKILYTLLIIIGLILFLVSALGMKLPQLLYDICMPVLVFCLIKIAIEHAPQRDKEKNIVKVLKRLGLDNVEESRKSVLEDKELFTRAKEKLWITGFFVNDLLSSNKTELLREMLEHAGRIKDLDFKLLMLAPLNREADLHNIMDKGRFVTQLRNAIDIIKNEIDLFNEDIKINLPDCIKLCQTYPMINLIISDDTAIFQSCFFKESATNNNSLIGVFKCVKGKSVCTKEKAIISWLESHFNAIWDKQSVSLNDYEEKYCRGTDCAIRHLDIPNMYVPQHSDIDALPRMLAFIKDSKKFLYIKQVSIAHILNNQRDMRYITELENALKRKVEVKLLFIDVDSEVAMMRSFCEHTHSNKEPKVATYDTFKNFKKKDGTKLRHSLPMYDDTNNAIEAARALQNLHLNHLQFKIYYAAPDGAIILNENFALFEPLHYGAKSLRKNANGAKILSGEMPHIEFKRCDDDSENRGHGYEVIKSNFEFVWNHLSKYI
jgi:hypothetical protein